jgi:hypothetical protein
MKPIKWLVLGWMAILIPTCSYANDSTGRVGVGGLELLKTEDIQMVSELLEISTSKIKVTYHFLNTSDHDITTTVAFPMPGFNGYRALAGGEDNQRPLDSFKMFVNGTRMPVNKNRVFLVNNVDVTDKLRKIGLSDKLIFNQDFNCLHGEIEGSILYGCKLTEKQNAAIKKLNAINGKIKETAYWEQTFPAGQEIEVVHEYKPFAGFYQRFPKAAIKGACLGNRTIKSIGGRFDEFGNLKAGFQDVEYILGTGRNWKGTIKNFRLIIKKGSSDEIVSMCFPGKPDKTSPTTLEFSQTDYVPQDTLVVYFLHVYNY